MLEHHHGFLSTVSAPTGNNGPGPTTLLAGDLNLGFYGEVTSAQLLTTQQLSDAVNFNYGTVRVASPVWLKFAYNGKTIFIAKTTIRDSVSWNQLYVNGLVYGTDNNGILATNASVPATTNQLRVVDVYYNSGANMSSFRVRLPRQDTTAPTAITSPDRVLRVDEWTDLIYAVVNRANLPVRTVRLANYADIDLVADTLSNGYYNLMREVSSVNQGNVVVRAIQKPINSSGVDVLAVIGVALANNNVGWRPVLELIDPTKELVAPYLPRYTGGTLLPLSVSAPVVGGPGGAFLLPAINVYYSSPAPIQVGGISFTRAGGLLPVSLSGPATASNVQPAVTQYYKATPNLLTVGGITRAVSNGLLPPTAVTVTVS